MLAGTRSGFSDMESAALAFTSRIEGDSAMPMEAPSPSRQVGGLSSESTQPGRSLRAIHDHQDLGPHDSAAANCNACTVQPQTWGGSIINR